MVLCRGRSRCLTIGLQNNKIFFNNNIVTIICHAVGSDCQFYRSYYDINKRYHFSLLSNTNSQLEEEKNFPPKTFRPNIQQILGIRRQKLYHLQAVRQQQQCKTFQFKSLSFEHPNIKYGIQQLAAQFRALMVRENIYQSFN